MNFRLRPRHLVLLFLLAVIVGLASWLPRFAQPTLTITITGEHNPVENLVFVNDARVFPSGEGGKTYSTKGKSGENKVVLNGPYIKTSEATATASLFSEQRVEMPTETQNPEVITRQILDEPEATLVGLRTFVSDLTIVTQLIGAKNRVEIDDEPYGKFLRYDTQARRWIDLTDSMIQNPNSFIVSESARAYFYELLED